MLKLTVVADWLVFTVDCAVSVDVSSVVPESSVVVVDVSSSEGIDVELATAKYGSHATMDTNKVVNIRSLAFVVIT